MSTVPVARPPRLCNRHVMLEDLCKILRRGLGGAVFRSPSDQPTRVMDNPSNSGELRRPRFYPTDSQLLEVADASVEKIQDTDRQQRPAPHTVQLTPSESTPDGCCDVSARRRPATRTRTELPETSTVVKDVRSTSRTKSPRGDARAATARNTCTPKVSTARPSAVFWRCCGDAAASALDQGLIALKAAWAQLMPTSSSRVVRLVQV